jgi:hypothetical protein
MEVEVIFDKFLGQWSIAILGKDGAMMDRTQYADDFQNAIGIAKNLKRKTGAESIRVFNREGDIKVLS